MLSIEEIKLLIEKLEKIKGHDLQKLVDSNLQILKDLAMAVDANNDNVINKMDKTPEWFLLDLEKKIERPVVDDWLRRMVQTKIFQFAKTNLYNSLEVGPGSGMFSREFRAWRLNFFLDISWGIERNIRNLFPRAHQKHVRFHKTDRTQCDTIPSGSCNLVFSWDTFVFFTQEHIKQYLNDI